MQEKQAGRPETMTDITVAHMLRQVGGPRRADETIKAVIWRVARRLGWPAGRVKRLWYGEARASIGEWEQLKAAVAARADAELVEAARVMGELDDDPTSRALGSGEVRQALLSLGRAAIALAQRIDDRGE